MSGPVLTAALTRLRADFDAAFPGRDRASDGWIGDAAHQAEVSGHNPDDTPGVTAEYSDADTKPEVRAIDVDSDLRDPGGVTMYDVIKRILATPGDLARLKYMIFCPPSGPFGANVPTIWSKSNGWEPRRYFGTSPHKEHVHFSGDPASDEDSSPWCLTEFEDDMTPSQQYIQHVMNYRVDGLLSGRATVDVPAFTATDGSKFPALSNVNAVAIGSADAKAAKDAVVALNAKVAAISPVDPAVVAAALAANTAFVDALAAAVAGQVGDREAAADRARADVLDGQ